MVLFRVLAPSGRFGAVAFKTLSVGLQADERR
jgi:hypothetical protein